ncbi:hypothetical protein JOL79_11130 [Microbispora sp. RL4-1S]|uniref:Uncharacterized protein n=1 Tax=Microbispora oryzae TaxID=2806554 RepID=A0A941AHQ9_9ACTN|nr:hypothetical protein [Microbispora oryzae]MBP2704365.1 hypothetical protein [Microbispora oryzae]
MTGGELVVIATASGIIYAAVSRANRNDPLRARMPRWASAGRRPGGGRRPSRGSLLVRFYNATGAPPVKADTASEAAAELAGRQTGRAARALHGWSGRRWAERTSRRPEQSARDKWRTVGGQARTWARERGERARARWNGRPRREEPTPSANGTPPAEPPAKPAPRSSPSPRPAEPDPKGTFPMSETPTAETGAESGDAAAPPLDWAVVIGRVANFVPEDDAALISFMSGETAGVLSYAEGLVQCRENCVNEVGLDPAAVSGITSYSEHMSEAAQRLAEARAQFMAVYGEVLNLAASGVQMPYRGRFFAGNAS